MFSYFKDKKNNKRRNEYMDDIKIFIQVHYVRERNGEGYKYNTLSLKTDPERDACTDWYKKHNNPDSFSEIVKIYLKEKNINIENVTSAYKLDSDILLNNPTTISKGDAAAVCIGLHLNLSETKALLEKAGHALNSSSNADLTLRFCIENGIYDFDDIQFFLSELCSTKLNELQ